MNAIDRNSRDAIVTFAIGIILGAAACLSQWPDKPGQLIVDEYTGCHYIVGPTGGVTPRLTAPQAHEPTGWHICSGEPGGDDAAWREASL